MTIEKRCAVYKKQVGKLVLHCALPTVKPCVQFAHHYTLALCGYTVLMFFELHLELCGQKALLEQRRL